MDPTASPHGIRVLVVDDHAVLREGICMLLGQHADLQVVGEARNGVEALDQVAALAPDVVLMDITMPQMDGLEATRQIKAHHPQVRVLVLTQHENKEYVLPLLQAGAAGYVLKKAGGNELVQAIRAVATEGAFLHPSVARAVMNQASQRVNGQPHLTEREKEVLILVAEGLSSREIATKLCLSEKTILAHRTNIMEKLNIHNRAELVRYAIREGLVKP
ncbi:MAG: response regulator transcription factor [Chloroflexi bacterium]|nr:response regulator transcription factor [Chloroflexota bacterium]